MPVPTQTPQLTTPRRFSWPLLATLVLGLALLAAYANSFRVPFVFDDSSSIADNLSLRSWRTAFLPPGDSGLTVSGRPLLNATFALNWALGGENVFGYHLGNLLIHFLAALTLFGLTRRTLHLPALRQKLTAASARDSLALAVSALWALHPLQTESVTYIVQRAESLVGLFYLLTLYCFVRSIDTPARARRWHVATVLSCLAGMASKEVMVSAPLIVFLFDRTFVSGSFAKAWRSHKKLHLALAATWILLAACILSTGSRGGTVGLHGHISAWQYFLTQCYAIVHYLRLTFWPRPLVLDYGTEVIGNFASVAAQFTALVLLGAGVILSLWKKPVLGFLGVVFFAVLAPTSSFIPVLTQTMAEHRTYLAIAPVIVFAIAGIFTLGTRGGLVVSLLISCTFGVMTHLRNRDYHTTVGLWEDNAAKLPANVRSLVNLSFISIQKKDHASAEKHLMRALELKPNDVPSIVGYGNVLMELKRIDEAIAQYRRGLTLDPKSHDGHYNYGKALLDLGAIDDAVFHLEKAVAIKPSSADAHFNLGNAYFAASRFADAVASYDKAVALDPSSFDALTNRGNARIKLDRIPGAITDYEKALSRSPENAKVLLNLGRARILLGETEAGIGLFKRSIAKQDDSPEAHANLANALSSAGRTAEAIPHYQRAIKLGLNDPELRVQLGYALERQDNPRGAGETYAQLIKDFPDFPDGHYALANLFLKFDQPAAAIPHYKALLKLMPQLPEAYNNLGIACAQLGRSTEARDAFEQALLFKPDFVEARENLERARAASPR